MLFSFSRALILYGLHIPSWQTDAQNRRSGDWGEKKKFNYHAFKPYLNLSSLFRAHLHLTLFSLCGKPQGHAIWHGLLLAKADESKGLECRHLFSISSVTHLCFIKSFMGLCWFTEASFLCDFFRDADSRGSLHSDWTLRLIPRSYAIIPHCISCQQHKHFLYCHHIQSTLALKLRTAE